MSGVAAPFDAAALEPFFRQFQLESDRACAILGATLLDQRLHDLLRRALRADTPKEFFSGTAPLATFSARIDVSFYLGLISDEDHRDLQRVRKIRNEFAHHLDHTLSFETPTIANRCRELALPKILTEHPTLRVTPTPFSPRQVFSMAVGMLTYLLSDVRPSTVRHAVPGEGLSQVIPTR